MQRSIKRKKQRKEPQMVRCFERGKMVMQRRGLVLKKTKQNKERDNKKRANFNKSYSTLEVFFF